MIEWALVAVLTVGAVIGWFIRNWSLHRHLSEQNRQQQLEQLHAPVTANAMPEQSAEIPSDDYSHLTGRVEQLELENHDLTRTFADKDREIDELYRVASLVKPLEFELQTSRAEVKRLRTEARQAGRATGTVGANDPEVLNRHEMESQLGKAQDELQSLRDQKPRVSPEQGDSNAVAPRSWASEEPADAADKIAENSAVNTLKSEIVELELINSELQQSHHSGEQKLLEIQSDLYDVRSQSNDYREKHLESVQLIDELHAKVRERDERITSLGQELGRVKQSREMSLDEELQRSRKIGDEIEESEEKLKLFDSTLARLTDLESEVSTNSHRSEEMQESLEQYRHRNYSLKEELNLSQEQVGQLSAQLSSAQKNSQEQLHSLNTVQSELRDTSEQLNAVQHELKRTTNENERLQTDIRRITLESEKLEDKNLANVQKSSSEINQIAKQLEDTQRALADSEKEVLRLQSSGVESEKALESANTGLTASNQRAAELTVEVNRLAADLSASEESRRQLQQAAERSDALSAQLQEEQSKVASLTVQAVDKERLESSLNAKEDLIQELNDKLIEAKSYKQETDLLTKKNDTLEKRLQEKQDLLSEKITFIKKLKTSVSELSSKTAATKARLDKDDVVNRKLTMMQVVAEGRLSAFSDLQNSLQASQVRVDLLQNRDGELKALRHRYELLDKKLVAKDVVIRDLQSAAEQSNEKITNFPIIKEQLESAQTENLRLKSVEESNAKRLEKLLEKMGHLEATATEQQNALASAENALKRKTEESENSKTALIEERGKNERLSEQQAGLSRQLEEQRTALDKSNENLADLKEQLSLKAAVINEKSESLSEMATLRESLQAFQEENSNLKLQVNRMGSLEAELKSRDKDMQRLTLKHSAELESLRDQTASRDHTIEELTGNLQQIVVINTELEATKAQLHEAQQQANRVTALQSTIRERDHLIVRMNGETEGLRQQANLLNQQLASAAEANDDLRRKAAKLPVVETSLLAIEEKLENAQKMVKAHDKIQRELKEKSTALSVLKDRNKALDAEFRKLIDIAKQHKDLTADYDKLLKKSEQDAQTLVDSEESKRKLQQQLDRQQHAGNDSNSYLKRQLDDEQRQNLQLAAKMQQSEQQLDKVSMLQMKLNTAEEELKHKRNLRAEFDALQENLNVLQASKNASDQALSNLKAQLSEETSTVESLRKKLIANAELQQTLEKREQQIAQLEKRLSGITDQSAVPANAHEKNTKITEKANKHTQPLFQASQEHDDLKKIYGIGPVMENTLNSLGITSFAQIANFDKQDIERVAAALDTFTSRIERDDWVGGAKKCYADKYGSEA